MQLISRHHSTGRGVRWGLQKVLGMRIETGKDGRFKALLRIKAIEGVNGARFDWRGRLIVTAVKGADMERINGAILQLYEEKPPND